MILIKNTFTEDFEVVTVLDPSVEGFNIAKGPAPEPLPVGQTICFTGYEPGVSFIIRPVKNADRPRSLFR